MFIYADESGNSGRNLFDLAQEIYRQGAILTLADAEPIVEPVIRPHLEKRGLRRIHANELPPHEVATIAVQLIGALDEVGPWEFHVTAIHKPYLATTKFVDTVFDSGENIGARNLWYNLEFLRHVICCAIDDMLTPRNRQRFWAAFLGDDIEAIKASIRNADTYLYRNVEDPRLREVIRDAFRGALRYPEQLTLSAARARGAYRDHTPNMVAFSSLLQAINEFAHVQGRPPVAFFHDEQQEFRTSLRQMHEFFGPVRRIDTGRLVSELIVRSWLQRIYGEAMPVEQLVRGRELVEEIEHRHLDRVRQFESERTASGA